MAIDEKTTALIHANIDGEITPEEKAELEAFLADSREGRRLDAELRSLGATLDSVTLLDPPQHLRHVVMNTIPKAVPEAAPAPGFLQSLFAAPALRYAATFAAGVVMTISIVDSGNIQQSAFDDVTGLVGTISDSAEMGPGVDSEVIHKAAVAGTVTLRESGEMLIIDFDVSTKGPIDIVASYDDSSIWFNGFAQLESTGTSVSAADGEITIQVEGKRRYVVYLHNSEEHKLSINLAFFADGEAIHEAVLEYRQPGDSN